MTPQSLCGSGGQDNQNRTTIADHDRAWPGRVLLVAPASTGGIGAHVQDLAEGLARAGHEVVLAAPVELAGRGHPDRRGAVQHVPVAIGRWAGVDPATVRRLRRVLPAVDVVHAHGWRAGAVAALATRGPARTTAGVGRGMAAVPLVVTLHNPPPRSAALPGLQPRLVMGRADVVLAGTTDLAAVARRSGAGQVQPAVIRAPQRAAPDPVDVERLRAELAPPGHRLVVAVARLAPQKGLDLLLDAVSLVQRRDLDRRGPHRGGPEHHAGNSPGRGEPLAVVVAGEGPLETGLQRRIDRERLPVRLLGPRDDVPVLLAAADLVVCPSRWEGPSLALQEALRGGRAVVATDVGGVASLVGDAALLVPGGDAVGLAHGIQQLLADEEQRKTLERRALDRARALPAQGDVVAATLAAYRAAARRAAPAGRPARRRR